MKQKLRAAQARKGLVSFAKYRVAIDLVLIKAVGMTSNCLPDWHWFDAYVDEIKAGDAVDQYLEQIELY